MLLRTNVVNNLNRVCDKQGSFKGARNYKKTIVNNYKEDI